MGGPRRGTNGMDLSKPRDAYSNFETSPLKPKEVFQSTEMRALHHSCCYLLRGGNLGNVVFTQRGEGVHVCVFAC